MEYNVELKFIKKISGKIQNNRFFNNNRYSTHNIISIIITTEITKKIQRKISFKYYKNN